MPSIFFSLPSGLGSWLLLLLGLLPLASSLLLGLLLLVLHLRSPGHDETPALPRFSFPTPSLS